MIANATDSDNVPPLEDMSHEIKTRADQRRRTEELMKRAVAAAAGARRPKLSGTSSTDLMRLEGQHQGNPMAVAAALEKHNLRVDPGKVAAVQKSLGRDRADAEAENTIPAKTAPIFSGLKKGFFSSPSSLSKMNGNKPPSKSKIETIRPTKPAIGSNSSIIFDEVQEAMKSKLQASTNDWMTSDFLSRIEANPILARALQDPEFQKATEELARNPHAAFEKYAKERPDLIEALREFSGLLGDHFGTMAANEEMEQTRALVNSAPIPSDLPDHEKELVWRVQTDKDLQDILRDLKVQQFLMSVQKNPPELQRALYRNNPEMRSKIEKLMKAGFLSIQQS
ncbi:hypothetical protein BC830DRAFT_1129156 [Chytriomyces sp. MP71]|nr:hypothetical protein BC830DRAFT_1129156 [Chytriomyces sp. MP71]